MRRCRVKHVLLDAYPIFFRDLNEICSFRKLCKSCSPLMWRHKTARMLRSKDGTLGTALSCRSKFANVLQVAPGCRRGGRLSPELRVSRLRVAVVLGISGTAMPPVHSIHGISGTHPCSLQFGTSGTGCGYRRYQTDRMAETGRMKLICRDIGAASSGWPAVAQPLESKQRYRRWDRLDQ